MSLIFTIFFLQFQLSNVDTAQSYEFRIGSFSTKETFHVPQEKGKNVLYNKPSVFIYVALELSPLQVEG